MFIFFTIIIVAIGLSMDTFSLSLTYGLFNISKKSIFKISCFVGLFHFFMPLLGNKLGDLLLKIVPFSEDILIGIIFLAIAIDLIISFFKEGEVNPLTNNFDIIIFSLTVSIDSFITGICLDIFNAPYFLISFIFMTISFIFTYIGLSMGSILHDKLGKISELIGIILLISLSISYLIH